MPSKPCSYPALDGRFVLHKTLGTGGFAKVKLATHILTGEKVAIKIMNKQALGEDLPRIKLEMEALKDFNHQNICKLYQVIETDTNIYLVLEYCPGGELFDYIIQKERLSEEEARLFFRQILAAVAYIHHKGYAHRDLKPENLLLDGKQGIKLIDFGLCAKPKAGLSQHLDTCCGSPAYAAPELINGDNYNGSNVDVWSMGILLYALLCGYLPFDDENVTKLYRKIQKGNYSCPPWLSKESKTIISDMLQVDPARRIPIDALLHHPWVTQGCDNAADWHSIYDDQERDQECLAELAVYYGRSMKSLEMALSQNRFDDLTAIYRLLVLKKRLRKSVRLPNVKPAVLREVKPCSRNLNTEFRTTSLTSRSSMDNLDDVDLLNLGSPKKDLSMDKENSPLPIHHQIPKLTVCDKENFVQPLNPTNKQPKKSKSKPIIDAVPLPSGLSNSMELHVTKTPVMPFLSTPLAGDKRAKSFEYPLNGTESAITPSRRGTWENASLSAKKMFGSIEKRLDRMKQMLTPNKHIYSCGMEAPRNVKSLCNVSATNDKVTPEEVLDSLQNALLQKGIPCKQRGYTLRGKIRDAVGKVLLKFELEVCKLPKHHLVGVRRKRLEGDAWRYKRICEEVLKLALLSSDK